MKKRAAILVSVLLVLTIAGAAMAAYPEKSIQGLIQWGAGGGTDNFARAVTPLVEKNSRPDYYSAE